MNATLHLCVIALFITFSSQKSIAQACSVSNITIKLNSATSNGGNCKVNVDISWDQVNNGGNKYTNIHVWTQSAYPNPQLTYAAPPTLAQLSGALGTVVVTNPTLASPTLNGSYSTAPTATILPVTAVVKTYVSGTGINTVNRFTLQGVVMTIPGACSNATKIVADIWSSNSNSDNAVQCAKPNNGFFVNDPLVSGSIICLPRTYTVNIASQSTAKTATYSVYADVPSNGVLDASDPVVLVTAPAAVPAAGNGSFTSAPAAFTNYENRNLWVRVQVTGDAFSTTALIVNTCPLLPVTLTGFEAQRQGQSGILLKWQTASEQNNKGFEVQRKTGTGNFETIGVVPAATKDGNSSQLLKYQYTDEHAPASQTQYRLLQRDIDGRQSFSKVIIINALNNTALSVLIYPNPSTDGNCSISFNDAASKDLLLTDNSGKTIQTVRNLSASQYSLQRLRSGLYFLTIRHQSTGETITRKIVVK
ncbi:MAG: T9SS type A sorting domain-containing protein [Pseudobacter sp.]|uniref:T9SS type A sorting domain-containing protein n=1 Tax=Pseudobacter sp. TaxID=2045420 RepID=UPI003F8213E8